MKTTILTTPPSPPLTIGYLNVPRYTGLSNTSAPASPTMSTSGLSLSVNYLPSKFSDNILTPRSRRRSGVPGGNQGPNIPKQGGGLAAFKSGEARIGGKGLRWTKFKWILFVANLAREADDRPSSLFSFLVLSSSHSLPRRARALLRRLTRYRPVDYASSNGRLNLRSSTPIIDARLRPHPLPRHSSS
ncbi:hypothetical protein NMY22_g15915 [Coprinellus aureogranulatus]|nr:hypothetical protein NMY22_g15915 [Coprinellus aureogranulatus]